jgi:putative addiction module component (TIGR02574 family)
VFKNWLFEALAIFKSIVRIKPMNATAEKIAAELMALPVSDRAMLAQRLIESLDEPVEPFAKVEEAWADEIARRTREIDKGLVECRPADEVLADIRKQLHDSATAS